MTWATSVPISVFLGLSVLDLGQMYATDRRQTDVRRASSLNSSYPRGGGIIILCVEHVSGIDCQFTTAIAIFIFYCLLSATCGEIKTHCCVVLRLCLQRLAVDALTSICFLNHCECGRRLRQRLLAPSNSFPGTVDDRSLISTISGARLLPSQRRMHDQRSFGNDDLLLSKKLDPARKYRNATGVLPSPTPMSAEVEETRRTAENAPANGAKVATKCKLITGRCDDADDDEDGSRRDGETKNITAARVQAALVVVTADMVDSGARIAERDGGGGGTETSSTATPPPLQYGPPSCSGTASVGGGSGSGSVAVAGSDVESLGDIPLSAPPTLTNDLSTSVAAADGQA